LVGFLAAGPGEASGPQGEQAQQFGHVWSPGEKSLRALVQSVTPLQGALVKCRSGRACGHFLWARRFFPQGVFHAVSKRI
jgi:hypothetical protein